jgi:hypothetical protein
VTESLTDHYWLVLAHSLRISHLQVLRFPIVLSVVTISLVYEELPRNSLFDNAVKCPSLHYPHRISILFFVSALFAVKPANHSPPSHSGSSRQISRPRPTPRDMSESCPFGRSTRRSTTAPLNGPGEGKGESKGCVGTLLYCNRSQSFLIYGCRALFAPLQVPISRLVSFHLARFPFILT